MTDENFKLQILIAVFLCFFFFFSCCHFTVTYEQ